MKTFQFPVTVTNHSDTDVDSLWTVRALKRSVFKGDPLISALPGKSVELASFGLVSVTPNQLLCRKDIKPAEKLKLRLAAHSSQSVSLVVDLATALDPARPQATLFALEERRSDGSTGGVVIALSSVAGSLVAQSIDLAPQPSPLTIVGAPCLQPVDYFCRQAGSAMLDRQHGAGYLGVLLSNGGSTTLKKAVLYLECLGLAGARWESRVYELDSLPPGEQFFAAFPLDLSAAETGAGSLTLVAYDAKHDRTRLRVELTVIDSRRR